MTVLTLTQTIQKKKDRCPDGRRSPGINGWITLVGWLALIWAFAFVFAPWLQTQSSAVRTLSNYIDSSGIDAGAIYYTEVEEVGEADLMIRDTFRFYLDEQEE